MLSQHKINRLLTIKEKALSLWKLITEFMHILVSSDTHVSTGIGVVTYDVMHLWNIAPGYHVG